jgi:phage terminase large subunit-like protein
MQNMLATMNTSRLGLHVYCGTPPKPEDNSETFALMRQEALSGEATDLAWIEIGADDDADLDDPQQWMKNPSIPHRTPLHAIQRLRRRLDDTGFRHEALGIWDTDEGSVFDIARWESLMDLDVPTPHSAALLIDVSPDRRWSTIAMAGDAGDGERSLVMVYSVKGTSQVVPQVVELIEKRDIIEVAIFAGGTARILEPALVEAGVEYEKLTAGDMAAAYGALQEAIKDGTVTHVNQPELNFAMEMTKTRFLQSGEAEAFDRRGHSVNISPAVAAAGALYRWNLQKEPLPVLL